MRRLKTEALFSDLTCETGVSLDHPLRSIRTFDEALEGLSPAPEKLYAKLGRPSIASEQLLRPAVPGVLFGTAKLAGAVA